MSRPWWAVWCCVVILPRAALSDPPSYLDRSVVTEVARRAVVRAGMGPEQGRSLSTRARLAALLPQVTVRVARGAGASTTQYVQPQTGDRVLTDDSLLLDVRVSLSLERLVFDPHEVTLAREELARATQRMELEGTVIELLARLERARRGLALPDLEVARRSELEVEFARVRARLELLSGVDPEALTRAAPR